VTLMRPVAVALLALALAAVPARAADPVLVAAGDVACDPDPASDAYNGGLGRVPPEETPGRCHQKYTADLIEFLGPTSVLALGDLQYDDGVLDKFTTSYAPAWGRASVKSRTRPVPGNHEYGSGSTSTTDNDIEFDAAAAGYFTTFDQQLADDTAASDPQRGWYSFDVPVNGTNWHIVALNSECTAGLAPDVGWSGGCEVGSEQERWLRADLATNDSDCTLAYWHHPLFSSDGSDGYPLTRPLWQALHDDYADIVLAGHRHNYERFAQQDPLGVPAPGRGVRSWIVGTGGHSLFEFLDPKLPTTEVRDNTSYGVLKLSLHGPGPGHPKGWYEWQFVGDGQSGSTFADSGSADCVEPPDPPVTTATTAKPTPRAVADRLAPELSKPRLSRKRFRVGRGSTARSAALPHGTVIGYTLSEPATTSLRIERRRVVRRKGRKVTRYRKAVTLKRAGKAGGRRVKFSGRVGRKRLAPGVYRVVLTPRDTAGNLGKPRKLLFRIVR